MGALKHPPEILLYREWPVVEFDQIPKKKQARFNVYKLAINAYCDGERPSSIARRYQISRSNLSYLLSRCVTRHPDGRVWGYRALLHGCRQVEYTRHQGADDVSYSDGYGFVGAFRQLLIRHPKVVKLIHERIDGVGRLKVREGGLNLVAMHEAMLKLLRKEGVSATQYPFNVASAGYFSLVRHVKQLVNEGDNAAARHCFGQPALDGLQAGTGESATLVPLHPLDIVCYDEQKLPFIGTLVIEVNGVEIDIPISRGYLCLLVAQKSDAILGYSIAISARFRAQDLLSAYDSFIRPWQPKKLTIPGLAYELGAGLPSGVLPECRGTSIKILSVDNHLTHLANAVVGHLRRRTGTILRFGKVRQWISRVAVEGVFAEMQKRGLSRIPSTTGSGPDDPAVKNPTKRAVDLKIRMEQLLELIDVIVANHNVTPRRSLMSKTPLEVLKAGLADTGRLSIIPRQSEEFLQDPRVAVEIITATIRGSRAKGRRPYIEIDKGKYTSDLLSQAWSLIGQRVVVHISGDFRKVRVFRQDGSEFGVVNVIGHWSRTFHTREVRKEINRLLKERKLDMRGGDPVAAYTEYLATQSLKKNRKNKYAISRDASKLANLMHDAGEEGIRYKQPDPGESPIPQAENLKPRGRRQFLKPGSAS